MTRTLTVASMLAVVIAELASAQSLLDPLLPLEWTGTIQNLRFIEPSGVVYHPLRQTIFVVGDNGSLAEMHTDGTLLREEYVRREDLEGITCHPESGLLYVVSEGLDHILEFDPETFKTTRVVKIDRTFQGETVLAKRGQGLQGITFRPDPAHPEGGTFFVVNQSFDLSRADDSSVVLELQVPLRDGAPRDLPATTLRVIRLGVTDMSGLVHDAEVDELLILCSFPNTLVRLAISGDVVGVHPFPGAEQQGIGLDPSDNLYIAQDSGDVVKLFWRR